MQRNIHEGKKGRKKVRGRHELRDEKHGVQKDHREDGKERKEEKIGNRRVKEQWKKSLK